VVLRSELGCEIVEDVSRISKAREENKRSSGAAPVEHFQLDVIVHSYKLNGVGGGIVPRGGLLR
jgi:hypothetical protein